MDTRINLQVCIYLWMMSSIITMFRGTVRATGNTQNGPRKPQNCSAIAFSSTAVLLTWDPPSKSTGVQNKRNFSIHYRPLYSKGKFTVLHVGAVSHKLIENLDVLTYYAFRIVASEHSGKHDYCEVLAKTMRDAQLSVPLQVRPIGGGRLGVKMKWKAVTLQDAQPTYRLFMEWQHKGQIHVRLLCETNRTSCEFLGKLPFPNRMYVSTVVVKQPHTFQAGNIRSYPTKKVLIPEIGKIPSKPVHASNKTQVLKVSVDKRGWDFVILSWNTINAARPHVTYSVTSQGGNNIIDKMTSNTSVRLSGLDQLTRYKVKVQARERTGGFLLASAVVVFNTIDKDECIEMSNICSDHSECVNARGSYFCRCLPGWTGDGKSCKEVDKENQTYCDNHNYANITWPITSQGKTALSRCPGGTRGIAKRRCLNVSSGDAEWGVPDLSECVSDRMLDIAQQLDDPDADVTVIAMQLVNVTAVSTHAQGPLQTGDLKLAVDVIEKISERSLKIIQQQYPDATKRAEKVREITQAVVKTSSNIVDSKALESWKFMPKEFMAAEASKLLKGVDTIGLHLAKTALTRDATVSEAPNVVLSAKAIEDLDPSDQRMPPAPRNVKPIDDVTSKMRNVTPSSVLLPGSVLMLQKNASDPSMTQYITFVSFRNLRALMQPIGHDKSPEPTEEGSDLGRIDSEITSVSLHPMKINRFEEPVILTIKNTQDGGKGQASCVFWNISGPRGFWSEEGCYLTKRNSSHTTCECDHLTSFAVLMRIVDMPDNDVMKKHQFALSLISYIGISISIVALSISFLTFTFLRFRNTRHRYFVHANLALSLGLAETLFLFGITKTANQIICKIIAITLHYLFLVSFCWMALEGIVLYLLLVKIFRSKTRPARDRAVFLFCGWGIPAIVVGGSAVLFHEGYGTEEFCWLSFERHFTWAFVGPVLLVCLFNIICLVKTFMIMSTRGSVKDSDTSIVKIRYWAKGCALLSCLLGLTWILGVFVVNQETIFMAYLFNIFNTLQGLMIFLFHCVGDEKVRAEYLRILRCQTRSQAYGLARPWWSKSDSFSRSRTWEERKLRRSTLQSNVDSPKTTHGSIQRRTNINTGPEDITLREGINRPMEMSQMYGIIDDCVQNNEETEIQQTPQGTEASTDVENQLESCEPELIQNSEESTEAEPEPVETGLTCSCESASQPNLPDVIQNDCKDFDKAENDSEV
ncbi:adhesion G protein-coupled receptor L4-like isoform X2 [Oculina patagonica]